MKTKILADFQIRISVPLIYKWKDKSNRNIYVQILFRWDKDVMK